MDDDLKEFLAEKIWTFLPIGKKRQGSSIVTRCPICGDSKKNLSKKRGNYSIDKGVYHCFNCDVSMSGMQLLKTLSGSSFDDIKQEYRELKLKNLGKAVQSPIKQAVDENLSGISYINQLHSIIKPTWKNDLSENARVYLDRRLVTKAPFLTDKLYSVYDKEQNEYILIPWKINSVDAYWQINDFEHHDKLNRKYIFPKDSEKLIYGLDNIDLSFPYIICFEGVYDSLFVKNGVCIGGKSLTKLQKEIISSRYPKHQICLSFDNDKPGLTAMKKSIVEHPTDFKYFKWFDENTKEKDINDFVVAKNNVDFFTDAEKLKKMILSSASMKLYLVQNGLWSINGRKA